MQGDLVFLKGLLINGFEVRDKVRTYLKQVGILGDAADFFYVGCRYTVCTLTDITTLLSSRPFVHSDNCVSITKVIMITSP